jgi:hypothetical protein
MDDNDDDGFSDGRLAALFVGAERVPMGSHLQQVPTKDFFDAWF